MALKSPELAKFLDLRAIYAEKAERCKHSYRYFFKQAWPTMEPSTPLLPARHIDALSEHLQAVADGHITRLLINIAPGHAKSICISKAFPAWIWTHRPEERFLCASHALDLAIRDNRDCRALIESEWYQSLFSDMFHLSSDQNAKSYFENNRRGYRLASAVRSSTTGKRGSLLIIDDANNAMAGEADILATIEWFGKTWQSRLNDQEKGAMIIVGQRLHQKDLSGHILALGGWEHVNLPTEYEPSRKSFTSIGWQDWRVREGEILWPERFTNDTLKALKRSLGPSDYAAQYQQRPLPLTGKMFDESNERLFSIDHALYLLETPRGVRPVPIKECYHFTASDVAAKEKEQNDWTVFSTFAITPDLDILLVDVKRGHWTISEQAKVGFHAFREFNSDSYQCIYFEDVGYQSAIGQEMIALGAPCLPFSPKGDKVLRAGAASIWQRLGKLYLLKGARWLEELREELYLFPKAAHDDQVDTISMAVLIVRRPSPLSEIRANEEDDIPPAIEDLPVISLSQEDNSDPFGFGGDW